MENKESLFVRLIPFFEKYGILLLILIILICLLLKENPETKIFLFFNVIVSALNVFIIVYAYSLNFFPKKWRKKVNQDTLVGLALIFITMLTMFSWIIYLYLKIFSY